MKYEDPEFQNKIEKTNIKIDGFRIRGLRTVDEHVGSLQKCLFVAKGPSLKFANNYTSNRHIATVNESCLKVDGQIDYAFFYDLNTLINSKSAWNRIKAFVMSAVIYGNKIDDDWVKIDTIPDLPLDRVITFYDDQHPWDYRAINKSLENGRFINTDTSVMGLHFLVKCGYKDIFLIGHDGGIGYANEVHGSSRNRNLQRFRDIIEFVSNGLMKRHSDLNISFI